MTDAVRTSAIHIRAAERAIDALIESLPDGAQHSRDTAVAPHTGCTTAEEADLLSDANDIKFALAALHGKGAGILTSNNLSVPDPDASGGGFKP